MAWRLYNLPHTTTPEFARVTVSGVVLAAGVYADVLGGRAGYGGSESAGVSGTISFADGVDVAGPLVLTDIPGVDPHVVGEVWNNAGAAKISAG